MTLPPFDSRGLAQRPAPVRCRIGLRAYHDRVGDLTVKPKQGVNIGCSTGTSEPSPCTAQRVETRSWRASHDSRSGLSRRTAAKRFMNH